MEARRDSTRSGLRDLVRVISDELCTARGYETLALPLSNNRLRRYDLRIPRSLVHVARFLAVLQAVSAIPAGESRTMRDLYYQDTGVFGTPAGLAGAVRALERAMGVCRMDMGIRPACRGLAYGCLVTKERDYGAQSLSCDAPVDGAGAVPDVVVVVEKEAVYQTALQVYPQICEALASRVLLVTGRGYPCGQTRSFVGQLSRHAPVLLLTDYDPYGLDIALQYAKACAAAGDGAGGDAAVRRGGLLRRQADEGMARSGGTQIVAQDTLSAHARKTLQRVARCGVRHLEECAGEMAAAGYTAELESYYGVSSHMLVSLIADGYAEMAGQRRRRPLATGVEMYRCN